MLIVIDIREIVLENNNRLRYRIFEVLRLNNKSFI